MLRREYYLKKLISWKDSADLIKVITGVRRCGKSSLLEMFGEYLVQNGVTPASVIKINFESMEFSELDSARSLHDFVKKNKAKKGKTYVLLDEVQMVSEWERAVNSLMVESTADMYITGSNSKLLSSELATYIAGRYVSIEIMPLSFAEYITFREGLTAEPPAGPRDVFQDYLRRGGFPRVALDNNEYEQDYKTIYDIYTSILLLDTVKRHNIRDLELLNRVIRFVLDNVGNTFSAKKIADYFKSQQRSVHIETIYNYLDALEGSYIITRIPRYDIRGKELLKTNEKYFVGDHSLIYALLGYQDHHISGVLENIVMLELKRRSYTVYTGKLGTREIDFIAQRRSEKVYIQVTYKLDTDTVIEREFAPLLAIRDTYPKYVLSLDDFWQDTVEGVKYKSLPEFLLLKEL
jgi:predicted AAA+ superfamily ATPase